MAHHSIFREELAIAYPTYGSALWEPDPGGQYNAVEVGDVGFIRDGYFQRLFNVLHPRDHPSHRNPSLVPEDHETLQPIPGHILRAEIRAGNGQNSNHFCSKQVTLVSRGLGPLASRPDDESQVTFTCDGHQGAILSLPISARSEDTVTRAKFGNWMVAHIDAWFAFTRSLGLGINRMEDIILVTGRHLTKSWINVAFNQRRRNAGVSFNAQVSSDSSVQLERQYVLGGELKLGPTGQDLPEDQCIFIRGFRVTRFLGIWPRIRGRAGPVLDTSEREPGSDARARLEVIRGPADDNHKDPLHVLLQYMAEQTPQCDMALVHDDDLRYIGGDVWLSSQPNELMDHLRGSSPTIQQFQCCLSPADESASGADSAVAKVATLSLHVFGEPQEGSTSRSSSSDSRVSSQPTSFLSRSTSSSSCHDIQLEASPAPLDYTVELNNFLQGHPTGNLTMFFSYAMAREGRDDAPTHLATAKFRGVEYAVGRGANKGAAKRDAAKQVYENFSVNGVP